MPTNLNALLRYKTIDECLNNPFAKCSIDYLIEKCSIALKESTGSDSGVSERTIRNDLRILKSDILGFNAPIVCVDSLYHYSVKNFSLFNSEIFDLQLLKEIQQLLVEEKSNIKQKNDLNYLLSKLSDITGVPLPAQKEKKKHTVDFKDKDFYQLKPEPYLILTKKYFTYKNNQEPFIFGLSKKNSLFVWGLIFMVLD